MSGPWEKYQAAPAAEADASADGPWAKYGTPNTEIDPSIPRVDVTGHVIRDPQPAAPADPSLVDRIKGLGEAGLAGVTGAAGIAIGAPVGAIKGLAGAVMNGTFGTQQGVQQIEQAAGEGAAALTYQPRTELGQEYTAEAGEKLNSILPITLMPELAAVSAGARAGAKSIADRTGMTAAASTARDLVTAPRGAPEPPVVAQIRKVSPAIADRVQRTLERNPAPIDAAPSVSMDAPAKASGTAAPTPGTKGSVGAAGVDIADQRRQLAADLPVPIELTKGQAERSFDQQAFEREIAKAPVGEPLRERFAQQNEDILKNMDAWFDQTGAQAPTLRAVGSAVDKALIEKAKADKARINVAYKEAEKAGEMAEPVSLTPVIDYLNAAAPDAETAPVLNAIRKHAVKLGIAEERNGVLVPTQADAPQFSGLMNAPAAQPGVTLQTAETWRKAINRATDYEPTNMRQAAIVKGLIDSSTENAGGDLYRAARRLRENFAKQYEDRAVIKQLLNTKKGMADRQVALEDVFDHAIMKGSLDDVRHVRRVLQTGGETGQQAWRELQGAAINHLKELATSNVALDVRGNPIVSAAKLDKAIKGLDAEGKLDFVFGKKNAQQLRDANDLVKLVYTAPPGAVQSSNNIVLLQHLTNFGDSGFLSKIPSSTLKVLRELAKFQKKRELQRRIEQALVQSKANSKNTPPARPAGTTLH